MKAASIQSLKCNYCKQKLKVKEVFRTFNNEIVHAIVECNCREYPIVNGVLFYCQNRITRKVLYSIRVCHEWLEGREELPLFIFNLKLGRYLTTFFVLVSLRIPRVRIGYDSLMEILKVLKIVSVDWTLFNRQRHETPHLKSTINLLMSLYQGGKILDIGCGTGYLLSQVRPISDRDLWGVDYDLIALYFAKKYIFSDANYVYLDIADKSPFPEGFFNYSLGEDSFHFIERMQDAAKEIDRITNKKGAILLTWLHNKKFFPNDKYSRRLSDYVKLFKRKKHYYLNPNNINRRIPDKAVNIQETADLVLTS